MEAIIFEFPAGKLTPQRELGLRIKTYRQYRNLSAREVEQRADLVRTSLSKIESGKRNIDAISLKKVATVLGISLEDFFLHNEHDQY